MEELFLQGEINEDFTITIDNVKYYKKELKKLMNSTCEIRIAKKYSKRSLQQNKWLWGVAYPLIVRMRNELGERVNSMEVHLHNLQIIQGIKYEIKLMGHDEVLIFKNSRSSTMTTKEFIEMVEKLQEYYSQNYDLYIPDPE